MAGVLDRRGDRLRPVPPVVALAATRIVETQPGAAADAANGRLDESEAVPAAVEWITAGRAVVTVSGDIDMLSAPSLQRGIDFALDKQPAVLVIDLSAVSFFGSSGLAVLVATQDQCAPSCTLRVVASNVGTRRPIEVTGLDQVLTVYATRGEAIIDEPPPPAPRAEPRGHSPALTVGVLVGYLIVDSAGWRRGLVGTIMRAVFGAVETGRGRPCCTPC